MLRPKSLFEVVTRINSGESFEFALAEFIDEINACENMDAIESMIFNDPGLVNKQAKGYHEYFDAYIGGIAEHISRINEIKIPEWTDSSDRMLKRAWFANSGLKSLNAMLIAESPLSFRKRFIFAEKTH